MKLCVLIPTYNEAQAIGSVVKSLKNKGLDVLVVDDGSTDETAQSAQRQGAETIRLTENMGKGASLKAGFRYALNKGYDAVITMDGDAQHSPEDIPKFIREAANPKVDMLVGNRMSSTKNMPLVRWITNNLMSFFISMICWRNIRDSQCGFRLIKTKVLKEITLSTSKYEIESEIIIAAHKKHFKIKFIPIQTIYAKEASQINPVLDTLRFFKFVFKLSFPFFF